MEEKSLLAHKSDLPNMINRHRWLKHLPNQSRTSRIRKRMSGQEWWNNMLNMENREKFMKYGLETKESSFLVN